MTEQRTYHLEHMVVYILYRDDHQTLLAHAYSEMVDGELQPTGEVLLQVERKGILGDGTLGDTHGDLCVEPDSGAYSEVAFQARVPAAEMNILISYLQSAMKAAGQ